MHPRSGAWTLSGGRPTQATFHFAAAWIGGSLRTIEAAGSRGACIPRAAFAVRPGAATIATLPPTAPAARSLTRPPSDGDRAAAPRPIRERQFRDALAQFATGVTVICARRTDGPLRRLHRQLVQLGVARPAARRCGASRRRAADLAALRARRALRDQRAGARPGRARAAVFAAARRPLRRRRRIGSAPPDAPLIEGCVAWFECRHHAPPRRRPRAVHRRSRDLRAQRARPRVPSRALRDDAAAARANERTPAPRNLVGLRRGLCAWKSAYILRNTGPGTPRRERPAVHRRHREHFLRRRRQPHLVGDRAPRPSRPAASSNGIPASRANSSAAS